MYKFSDITRIHVSGRDSVISYMTSKHKQMGVLMINHSTNLLETIIFKMFAITI